MSLTLKRLLFKGCTYIWQILRVCTALLLLAGLGSYIYVMATAPDTPAPETSETAKPICGRLSGKTIVVPRSYVIFWPEYEGASAWDKQRIHNKRGCDAQLVSLPLVMTWPQLQPANQFDYFRDGLRFDGLEVTVAPAPVEHFDLRTRLDALLAYTPEEKIEVPAYVEGSGLYWLERKDRTFPDVVNGYYWKEQGGKVEAVFECLGNKGGQGYYHCQAEFMLKELSARVTVGFSSEKFKDWNQIESAVKEFVLSSVEK